MDNELMDMPKRYFPADMWTNEIGIDQRIQQKWKIPEMIVIKAAVTGAMIKRAINPHQPYLPEEIRKEAVECIEAGATSIHIHARTDEGDIPLEGNEYMQKLKLIIDPIRNKYGNNVIIDGCVVLPEFEDEVAIMKSGLLEMSPVNPFWMEPKKLLQAEAQALQENGIKPEIAIYSDGDLDRAKSWLIDTGIMKKPLCWLLLPSYYIGCSPLGDELAAVESLLWHVRQIRRIDPESIIMVCMAGRPSSYLTTMAMLLGLHVRVGMEDSFVRWPHKDDVIKSNAKMVADTIAIAKLLGRRSATDNEYRSLVGLPGK